MVTVLPSTSAPARRRRATLAASGPPKQLRWEGRAGPGGEAVDAKDVLQPDQNAEKRRARLRIGVALEERFRLSVEAAAALRLGQQGADGGFEGL